MSHVLLRCYDFPPRIPGHLFAYKARWRLFGGPLRGPFFGPPQLAVRYVRAISATEMPRL
jgi:hypothetical protein